MDPSTDDECLQKQFTALSITNMQQNNYNNKEDTDISIDDKKQVNSSIGFFHSKYSTISVLCETNSSTVYIGSKSNGTKVVIKRSHFDDEDDLEKSLENGMPLEVHVQQKAERITVEEGKGNVLKVLDWYVYDTYIVIIIFIIKM